MNNPEWNTGSNNENSYDAKSSTSTEKGSVLFIQTQNSDAEQARFIKEGLREKGFNIIRPSFYTAEVLSAMLTAMNNCQCEFCLIMPSANAKYEASSEEHLAQVQLELPQSYLKHIYELMPTFFVLPGKLTPFYLVHDISLTGQTYFGVKLMAYGTSNKLTVQNLIMKNEQIKKQTK